MESFLGRSTLTATHIWKHFPSLKYFLWPASFTLPLCHFRIDLPYGQSGRPAQSQACRVGLRSQCRPDPEPATPSGWNPWKENLRCPAYFPRVVVWIERRGSANASSSFINLISEAGGPTEHFVSDQTLGGLCLPITPKDKLPQHFEPWCHPTKCLVSPG